MARLRPVLLSFFFVSGFCGLVYEVVWTRALTLTFGATAASVAAVLSSYMAGLGLGAALAGRWGKRVRRPLRLYGALELGVAATAIAVRPALVGVVPWLQRLYTPTGPSAAFQLARFGIAFAILLAPTALMGATLPALADALTGEAEEAGIETGRAYAVNTLGAMAGAFLTGFILIRALGMRNAELLAVALNAGIGLAALALGRVSWTLPRAPAGAAPVAGRTARLAMLLCGTAGLCSLAHELLWTRFFVNAFHSTVAAFSMVLMVYLCGLGLGAVLASWLNRRRLSSLAVLGAFQAGAAVLTVLLLGTLSQLPSVMQGWTRSAGSFQGAAALLTIAVILAPILMGTTLPLAVHVLRGEGAVLQTVSRLYGASSIGSAIGPALTGFVLLPWIGAYRATLAIAFIQLLAAGIAIASASNPKAIRVPAFAVAGVSMALVLAVALTHLQGRAVLPKSARPESPSEILSYEEGPYGTVLVTEETDSRTKTLFVDGFAATSNGINTDYMRLMAHLPMLLQGSPSNALVICLGTGITLGAISLHQPLKQQCVELSPSVVRASRFFSTENHQVLDSPRTELVLDDGRNFLRMSTGQFDVITLEPLAPFFAGTVSLYSREFNQLARDHLRAGGVFAQWLPLHLVTDADARMIVRAIADVFPHVLVWKIPGDATGIVLASDHALHFADGPLQAHPEVWAAMRALGFPDAAALEEAIVLPESAVARYTANTLAVTDNWPRLEYRDWSSPFSVGRKLADANTRELRIAAGLPEAEPSWPSLTRSP